MTDRYENIRRALADMDAAAEARHALAWQDAHARFAVHVTPGTIQALLAERDALLSACKTALAWSDQDWVGYEQVRSAVGMANATGPSEEKPDERSFSVLHYTLKGVY